MMNYSKKHLMLSVFWIILGLVFTALAVTGTVEIDVLSGLGGGLIAVGVLQLIRNLRYRKDPAYREKVDTETGDERYRFIRMKSWSWAGCAVIAAEGIGTVAARLMGQDTVSDVLSYSVCLLLCAYWISFLVISRKY
jgi:predicted phage tail protein